MENDNLRSNDYYKDCQLCNYASERNQVVYARYGNIYDNSPLSYFPKIMIISENVCSDIEDETGLPIVGDVGILLENILESIGLKSSDVYITTAVKCKTQEKISNNNFNICVQAHLLYQIKKVEPKIIITLGSKISEFIICSFSQQSRNDFKITRDRGKVVKTKDFFILPLYALPYLLRNHSLSDGSKKYETWQDLKQLLTDQSLSSLL